MKKGPYQWKCSKSIKINLGHVFTYKHKVINISLPNPQVLFNQYANYFCGSYISGVHLKVMSSAET